MIKFETVIGMEFHIQLNTKSKMFCRCDNYSAEAKPNTNTCPTCMGFPGTLPVANEKAIEWTMLLGLALNGKVADSFNFERKNYFYPDLPKAYQITSSTNPPVVGGYLDIVTSKGESKIRINHIHLEEDAGKLVHASNGNYSLVDLNRASTPLMELVTEADFRTPEEARVFAENLRSIVRYLGISSGNMEEGNLRADANISLRPVGQKEFGKKVEIKNMNSFKSIERALEYEVKRQTETLSEGGTLFQETRGWDENKGKTMSQRSKEEAHDYRYFPEPDLPPFKPKKEVIDRLKAEMPELPSEKRERFEGEYGLTAYDAMVLTSDVELARFFEQGVEEIMKKESKDFIPKESAKKLANWTLTELLGRLNAKGISVKNSPIKSRQLADLIALIDEGTISGKIAKTVFDEMFETGKNPEEIIKDKGLVQITDTKALEETVDAVLDNNPKSVEDFKAGKAQAFGFLIGQVMKETKGQANPKIVNEILRKKLS
ncbi:MAG: Aspartyl/glutamyl-tRNA(Asn/Gln) amidotransferase subunit B [candidate division CPR2 bacterium GW2011_GWC1_41_48]|uniref:Aspartyl/glutamyl-tRNA(Asn/Gln) amidotransferase subunit B n=1 Tax=candidate division CPR2 bacterium GW2011_GWC1_41_48 TaxID=1618344 RepID=A0A0G0W6W4_UNCC2|nr:MAG: Aspartyl/glutamyl-tRNA(Asn/Gln) amidotransferase subunit B [candidate division CPR2 bacterium GW2011_GWC2_39_35]KKR28173.1 MAG: Aspartyl/glutamyl-tRNA(Asn/Gln) amidotransferase subunit B [candidate division CPR2 bacterium GW2011_GWD2_39_7]KKS08695.1 MAG: Aspartyl/glutamyl-tRNA(Asn/Gln) amidotransferase subunit B [candidate division CPR2 bacterium GW2011_GWC1_41_48]OGB72284.1 MAG: aspartyl/glutamyl-tRNA amidotransferase subunit B [candidate division CPR2 bacterium GWD2_39_7]